MKTTYNVGENVVLKWDDSDTKATHFSTRVEKKQSDGTWKYVSGTQYAESGKDTHTFNAGHYRAHVIAYTSKYWEVDKSDWLHAAYDDIEFDVICAHKNVTTTVTKEPTCTEKGESTSKCSDCGETFTSEIPTNGHSWDNGVVTTSATDGATVVKMFTCTVCETTKTEEIPQSHIHTFVTVHGKPATCTEDGLTDYEKCSVCGGVTNFQKTIPATGHSWNDGIVTTPATIGAPGVKTYTCTECGATKTEEIPKLSADDTPGADPVVDGAVISVSSATANPGETVELKVSVSGNPGINTFGLGFDYDTERLTLQNVTASDALGGQFTYSKKAVWLNSTDSTYNGEILTLTFKVNDNAPVGSAAVKATYQPGDISNYNEENVDFKLNAGAVNVGDSSASGFVISVSSAEAAPGDTVDLDVNISNNPGINTFSFGFEYDANALELTAVNIAPELGGQFTYAQKAVWLASQDTSFNGKILTLTFKVKSGAPLGAATVSVTCAAGDISNYKEEDIAFKLTAGQINVVGAYMLGDVDLNGKVDAVDARLALRAAAKLDTLTGVRLINADVDENNAINSIDARVILRVAAKLESMRPSQAEYIKSYNIPGELGSDMTAGIINLDGDLYRLPIPVSAMKSRGWEFRPREDASVIPAGGKAQVEIWRPGYYIVTYIENRGDAEISIDDAVIVSLGCDTDPPQYVLPCGIGVGTSEADLQEALKSAEVDYKCSDGVYTFLFGAGFSYGRFIRQGIAIYIDSETKTVKQMEIRESSDELITGKNRVENDTMHCIPEIPSEY